MIDLTLSSFSEIKTSLEEFIADNREQYGLIDTADGSVKTMIIDLLAGFTSFLQYKYVRLREESYLSSAKLDSSVYAIARHFGYRINRATAPKLVAKYSGSANLNLSKGLVVGTMLYRGEILDITYFGNAKVVSTNAEFEVVLGNYHQQSSTFSTEDFTKTVILSTFKNRSDFTVDNNCVSLTINAQPVDISHDLEDFVTTNATVDLTTLDNTAEIWVTNSDSSYGLTIQPSDVYKLEYIETPGYQVSIDIAAITTSTDFSIVSVTSLGASGDSAARIKEIVPNYYATFRRMVTLSDHRTILRAFPGILDVFIKKSDYLCCTIEVTYLVEGSGAIPRVYTQSEFNTFTDYIDYYKVVGLKYLITAASSKVIDLIFIIDYNCNLRNITNGFSDLESTMLTQADSIIDSYQLTLGNKFYISEIIIKLGNISYNNSLAVNRVAVKQRVGNTIIDITEETLFEATPIEYFHINRNIELNCS